MSAIALLAVAASFSQTTEFTYQGSLKDLAIPANGNYDFEFQLIDSGSNSLGTLNKLAVPVTNGSFATKLDFGSSPNLFTGEPRFLQISVRPSGMGLYSVLSPNQMITAVPYAIRSLEAATADTAANATQLGGVPSAQFVQSDVNGNVSVSGNLSVTGALTQSIVNATTEYQIGGQRVFRLGPFGGTFVGLNAGVNTVGGGNSFFGSDAGTATTTGTDNSYFGRSAGQAGTINVNNSFFGVDAGRNNTADGNSFFGRSAGFENTSGSYNAFLGYDAGRYNTTGSFNAFFGYYSGRNNTTGNNNSFYGLESGRLTTTGDQNSFFGTVAGRGNTIGFRNSFFGVYAGYSNTEGIDNSYFGHSAGQAGTLSSNNSFFGVDAGRNNTANGQFVFWPFRRV